MNLTNFGEININRNNFTWEISKTKKYTKEKFTPRIDINDYLLKHLSIAITSKCNLNCSYCYKSINEKQALVLDKKIIFKFIDNILKYYPNKIKTIQLIGGEPLIHPDINEIIEYILDKKILVRISTNGTLSILQDYKFKDIVNNPNVEFRISLDSYIEEENDFYRGKGSFKKIIKNISFLTKCKCKLSIKSVLTKNNIDSLEQMLLFLKNLNIKSFAFTPIYNLGNSESNYYDNTVSHTQVLYKICDIFNRDKTLLSMIKPNIIKHTLDLIYIKNPYILNKMYLYINFDGNIYPQDQLTFPEFSLGNINDTSLNINTVIHNFKNFKLKYEINKERCLKCEFYPFCVKGNYGELYNIDKTLNKDFPNCNDLKQFISLLMKNNDISKKILLSIYGK